ncbi:preprotein translocase subunit SecG [Candidatus Parcubacteria bacterium]|nr:preprotein translocase subunit SecG [Candidatus Parcubacteria bacterium]
MSSISGLLPYIQIVLSVALIGAILLQRSDASLGETLGGGDSFSMTRYSRRGIEKVLFNATIVIAILFALSAFLALVIR